MSAARKVIAVRLLDPHSEQDACWVLTLDCGHERRVEVKRARGVGTIKLPPRRLGCRLCVEQRDPWCERCEHRHESEKRCVQHDANDNVCGCTAR